MKTLVSEESPLSQFQFPTPLNEACAQVNLLRPPVLDVPGATLYRALAERFPQVEPLPFILVPPGAGVEGPEPPAYRFHSDDGLMVQFGPTLLAVNATRWPGFESFLKTVNWVAAKFGEVLPASTVRGFSLGFYNRIRIARVQDLAHILRLNLNVDDNTLSSEFLCQFATKVEEGSLLTQVVTTPGPVPEGGVRTANVNNVVRHLFDEPALYDSEAWCRWLAQAHDTAKSAFWNSLTPETQEAWRTTTNAAG